MKKSSKDINDLSIQGTNDSSIVSKRSVERLYLKNQNVGEFLRYFVKKPVRRSPTINRGYWIRMKALKHVLDTFIKSNSDGSKTSIIVNLGCGYDPYPFQHLYQHNEQNIVFIDVDYPQLIEKKVNFIKNSKEIMNLLNGVEISGAESIDPVEWKHPDPIKLFSKNYIAMSCDLRNIELFSKTLNDLFSFERSRFMFTGEVSLTYMDNDSADKLIEWTSKLPDAQFALLEQISPSSSHPFTKTMLDHFNHLGTPIHSLMKYPRKNDQKSRFTDLGWKSVEIQDLYEFWQLNISDSEKFFVESVEEFDELEEFILFCQHYFILHACTIKNTSLAFSQIIYKESRCNSETADLISEKSSIKRRFAASCKYNDLFIQHGGLQNARLSSINVLKLNKEKSEFIESPCSDISARMCHTLTSFGRNKMLLVGGRQNPGKPLKDCWIFNDGNWKPTAGLPHPRFRHAAISLGDNQVLVFGGCTNSQDTSFFLWTEEKGWAPLSSDLSSRKSSAMVWNCDAQEGYIIGGSNHENQIQQDLIKFSLAGDRVITETVISHELLARYGSCAVCLDKSSLIVAGGVSPYGLFDKSNYFIRINLNSGMITKIDVNLHDEICLPMPVGMNLEKIDDESLLLFGGGAVCFSFGSFWNDIYQINFGGNNVIASVTVSQPQTPVKEPRSYPEQINVVNHVSCRQEFEELCSKNMPFLMAKQKLGDINNWTNPEHLIEKVGADTKVVIHKSDENNLNFQQKNFKYQTVTFSELVNSVFSNDPGVYLRSLSHENPKGKPANLSSDFPELSNEFKLPDFLKHIEQNHFSSPLRITSPNTAIWLHYDVTANVLCQVVGSKRVKMYPPVDVKYLDFPPGASSSSIDNIFQHKDHPKSHPLEFVMEPGDILYIPPMWLHALQTSTPSISVNFFWKDLPEKVYAAGRDVYGNRDLAVYENGRKQIESLVKSFSELPTDIRSFYLQRLGQELFNAS